MDNNVSKNTNSHNFFKLRFNREKLGISVKNLLKRELVLILDLYQQEFNVQIEPKLLSNILSTKIAIDQPKNSSTISPTYLRNNIDPLLSRQFLPIIYACPLGMSLATNLQLSPPAIMEQIGYLMSKLALKLDQTDPKFSGQLITEIVPLGWCNFYLDSQLMADWLQRSLFWSQSNTINNSDQNSNFLEQTPGKLFPAQYIHARCSSLLGLGARENLIILSNDAQQIEQLESRSWLDPEHQLWLTEVAERDVLQQLLITSDAWMEKIDVRNHLQHWSKLALSLSQKTAIFLADCRFLGEVKQQYPQKAIARLGLIALVQFWLEKILVEKLRVAAPRDL
jgi:DALR anticodon binding domain